MKTPRKKFKTVDEYVSTFPKDAATRLETIRKIVAKIVPQSTEAISYNIPTFKLNNKYLLYCAAYETHIGIYPYSDSMNLTPKELAKYRTGKGTLQFPLDQKLPVEFIQKIIKNKVKAVLSAK